MSKPVNRQGNDPAPTLSIDYLANSYKEMENFQKLNPAPKSSIDKFATAMTVGKVVNFFNRFQDDDDDDE